MKTVCLISCVKRKKPGCHPAKDLYDSTLFNYHYQYAMEVLGVEEEDIYIISAEHGLISSSAQTCNYDKTLRGMPKEERKEWASMVSTQLQETLDLENSNIVILAGVIYYEYLLDNIPHYELPEALNGLPIGKRLGKLKSLVLEAREQHS